MSNRNKGVLCLHSVASVYGYTTVNYSSEILQWVVGMILSAFEYESLIQMKFELGSQTQRERERWERVLFYG